LGGMSEKSLVHLNNVPSRCEVIAHWIYRLIVRMREEEERIKGEKCAVLEVPPPLLTRALNDLASALVDVYRARKIAEIPFPFPYAQMITLMLIVFSMVTPVLASQLISSVAMAAVATFCVTAGYWSLFHIADEIDQPFGSDPNDLNLRRMQRDFNVSLKTLLNPLTQSIPDFDQGCRLRRISTIDISATFPATGDSTWRAKDQMLDGHTRPRQIGLQSEVGLDAVCLIAGDADVFPDHPRSLRGGPGIKKKRLKKKQPTRQTSDLEASAH